MVKKSPSINCGAINCCSIKKILCLLCLLFPALSNGKQIKDTENKMVDDIGKEIITYLEKKEAIAGDITIINRTEYESVFTGKIKSGIQKYLKNNRNSNKNEKVGIKIIIEKIDINSLYYTIKISIRGNKNEKIYTNTYKGYDQKLKLYIQHKIKKEIYWDTYLIWSLCVAMGIICFIILVVFYKPNILQWESVYCCSFIFICTLIGFIISGIISHHKVNEATYFSGSEINFFIDRNNGLLYKDGEKFNELIKNIINATCTMVNQSDETARREQNEDDWFYKIVNKILAIFGIQPLHENKKIGSTDYTFSIHTFHENDIQKIAEGSLSKLEINIDSIVIPLLDPGKEYRNSTLVDPISKLYQQLIQNVNEEQPKKKFIIILTDATEEGNEYVTTYFDRLSQFAQHKNQYLRVFSILFPSIPRESLDESYFYAFEEAKVFLLTTISEMVVYLNDVDRYTPENLENIYKKFIANFKNLEQNKVSINLLNKKIETYESILYEKEKNVITINDLKKEKYLKEVEERYVDNIRKKNEKSIPFFMFCTTDSNLYTINTLDYGNRKKWENIGDFTEMRSKLFNQFNNPGAGKMIAQSIADIFAKQFMVIDQEVDHSELILSLNIIFIFLSIIMSLVSGWITFRYQYEYKKSWFLNGEFLLLFISLILLGRLTIFFGKYFSNSEQWIIYGNLKWALIVFYIFFILHWIVPYISRRIKFNTQLSESTFYKEKKKKILFIEEFAHSIIGTILTLTLFILITCPVSAGDLNGAEMSYDYVDKIIRILNFNDYSSSIKMYFTVMFSIAVFWGLRSFMKFKIQPGSCIEKE